MGQVASRLKGKAYAICSSRSRRLSRYISTKAPLLIEFVYISSAIPFLFKHEVAPGAPSAWLAYVLVDDIAAATAKAKSLGAKVMKDVTEVMGEGWLRIIVDPTGACLGLWKPKTP